MTEHQSLVIWRTAPDGRLLADLPHGCFASIEELQEGNVYFTLIGCDGQQPLVLTDRFDNRDVAQAWVEDKAHLLARGIDIALSQRSGG
jgi:hypothetical protein